MSKRTRSTNCAYCGELLPIVDGRTSHGASATNIPAMSSAPMASRTARPPTEGVVDRCQVRGVGFA